MDISEGWSFEVNGLKPVIGKYGDEMTVGANLGKTLDFAKFDLEKMTLTIQQGTLTAKDVGVYPITIFARFQNKTYTERYEAQFWLEVRNDNPVKVWAKKPQSATSFSVRDSIELGPGNSKQPIPYIRDLTSTGVLVIAWDRLMTQQNDFGVINPSRVAVHNKNSTASDPYGFEQGQNGRRLNVRFYDKLENTDKTPEWYLILEALEIKVRPGDFSHEQYLNLTWDMVSYGQDEIQIQLYFEYPGRVSEWDVYDTVEVYFWEPDFFKS